MVTTRSRMDSAGYQSSSSTRRSATPNRKRNQKVDQGSQTPIQGLPATTPPSPAVLLDGAIQVMTTQNERDLKRARSELGSASESNSPEAQRRRGAVQRDHQDVALPNPQQSDSSQLAFSSVLSQFSMSPTLQNEISTKVSNIVASATEKLLAEFNKRQPNQDDFNSTNLLCSQILELQKALESTQISLQKAEQENVEKDELIEELKRELEEKKQSSIPAVIGICTDLTMNKINSMKSAESLNQPTNPENRENDNIGIEGNPNIGEAMGEQAEAGEPEKIGNIGNDNNDDEDKAEDLPTSEETVRNESNGSASSEDSDDDEINREDQCLLGHCQAVEVYINELLLPLSVAQEAVREAIFSRSAEEAEKWISETHSQISNLSMKTLFGVNGAPNWLNKLAEKKYNGGGGAQQQNYANEVKTENLKHCQKLTHYIDRSMRFLIEAKYCIKLSQRDNDRESWLGTAKRYLGKVDNHHYLEMANHMFHWMNLRDWRNRIHLIAAAGTQEVNEEVADTETEVDADNALLIARSHKKTLEIEIKKQVEAVERLTAKIKKTEEDMTSTVIDRHHAQCMVLIDRCNGIQRMKILNKDVLDENIQYSGESLERRIVNIHENYDELSTELNNLQQNLKEAKLELSWLQMFLILINDDSYLKSIWTLYCMNSAKSHELLTGDETETDKKNISEKLDEKVEEVFQSLEGWAEYEKHIWNQLTEMYEPVRGLHHTLPTFPMVEIFQKICMPKTSANVVEDEA